MALILSQDLIYAAEHGDAPKRYMNLSELLRVAAERLQEQSDIINAAIRANEAVEQALYGHSTPMAADAPPVLPSPLPPKENP